MRVGELDACAGRTFGPMHRPLAPWNGHGLPIEVKVSALGIKENGVVFSRKSTLRSPARLVVPDQLILKSPVSARFRKHRVTQNFRIMHRMPIQVQEEDPSRLQ